MPLLPHPDDITGALSELLRFVARPVSNSLAALEAYSGRSIDELFPAPHEVPDVRIDTRWRVPGLVSEDLVFRSLHEPIEPRFRKIYLDEYPEAHTVYAKRIRPAAAGKRPRLLYLHGYMQPETYLEEVSLLSGMALRLNVEIIQVQPPYHGRRTPRGSLFGGELYWTADLVRSVEALRQSVLDARTVLTYLLKESERPVGVSGISLGGALALTLTCLDERFAFSAPMIAHMDLAALVADAPVLGKMRRDLRTFGWDKNDFRDFIEHLGLNDLDPKLSRDRILLFAASDDRFFDPRVVEAMWERWHKPAIHWYPVSHMGFLTRLPEVTGILRTFIDQQTPPTRRRSRRQPT